MCLLLVSAHQNQINIDSLYLFNEKGRSVARCPKPRNLINKLIKLQVRNFR